MVVHTSLVFAAVSHGFGKIQEDISNSDSVIWQKVQVQSLRKSLRSLMFLTAALQDSYISDIFHIFTLWSTKLSVAFLFIRLSPYQGHKLASYVFIGVSAMLVTISVFLISLQCNISQPWLFVGVHCPGLVSDFHELSHTVLAVMTWANRLLVSPLADYDLLRHLLRGHTLPHICISCTRIAARLGEEDGRRLCFWTSSSVSITRMRHYPPVSPY